MSRSGSAAADPVRRDRQFFGRQRGHRLSPTQTERLERILPRLRIDIGAPAPRDVAEFFAHSVAGVRMEIGFGGGEHLAAQAAAHPDIGFIGVEPFINGVSMLLGAVERQGLDNIRIFDFEAGPLLDWLPDRCLGRLYVLFPDPWPKRRHQKRRLVSPRNVARMARLLKPGAELRVATDIGDYAASTLTAVTQSQQFDWLARQAADWRVRPADAVETRFERKAIAAGRRCYYLRFERRADGAEPRQGQNRVQADFSLERGE